jgi:hypothetical protein
MTIDWSRLKTFDDWAQQLRDLLDRASKATADDARSCVSDELLEFVEESPDDVGGVRDLDRRAREAIQALASGDLQAGLADLRSRSSDLENQLKLIREVTAQANKEAASIRLQNLNQMILSATDTITALKEAKAAIGGGSDVAATLAKLEKGIASLAGLKKSLEGLIP